VDGFAANIKDVDFHGRPAFYKRQLAFLTKPTAEKAEEKKGGQSSRSSRPFFFC